MLHVDKEREIFDTEEDAYVDKTRKQKFLRIPREGGDDMKGRTFRTALVAGAGALLPLTASALSYIDPSGSIGLGSADLRTTVTNIINWVLGLLGIVAVIMILYGGFMWLTAGGSEDRITSAKKIISAAVVGLVIILLAWAIVNFVLGTTANVSGTRGF